MAFLNLCGDDPLLTTLRDVFSANPVLVPEERIMPLTVLASNGDKSHYIGELKNLLAADNLPVIDPMSSDLANLSGKRSRGVNIDLGLKILDGFLGGFGIPTAGITVKFDGASEVAFSFQKVSRKYVDIGHLGHVLADRKIDMKSPAAAIFFGDSACNLLVIDSVIQSNQFEIAVTKKRNADFSLDIPVIQTAVANAKVGVNIVSASSLSVAFQGTKSLSFAFSCVRLYLDSGGNILTMPPEDMVPQLRTFMSKSKAISTKYSPDRVLLGDQPGMVSFE